MSDPPSPGRALARAVFRRLPDGTERLLDVPAKFTEHMLDRPWAQRRGDRLLAAQRQITFDRAASHEVGSAAKLEAEFGRLLPVLMYHRVGDPLEGMHSDLTVSPRRFSRQMSWLARRGYTSIEPLDW